MAGFAVESLLRKLQKVNESAESIESLSLWLIHHAKHAKTIADAWIQVYQDAKSDRYKALFYLVNDVLQNGRRRGSDFSAAFRAVLPRAMALAHGRKCQSNFERTLIIWKERRVYDSPYVSYLRQVLGNGTSMLTSMPIPLNVEETYNVYDVIEEFQQVEANVASKMVKLNATRINTWDNDVLSTIKDKTEGHQFKEEVDEAVECLKECCKSTEKEIEARRRLITALQQCLIDQKDDAALAKKLVKQMTTTQSHVHKAHETIREERKRRKEKEREERSHHRRHHHRHHHHHHSSSSSRRKSPEKEKEYQQLKTPFEIPFEIPSLETGASFLMPVSGGGGGGDVIESTDMDIDTSGSDGEQEAAKRAKTTLEPPITREGPPAPAPPSLLSPFPPPLALPPPPQTAENSLRPLLPSSSGSNYPADSIASIPPLLGKPLHQPPPPPPPPPSSSSRDDEARQNGRQQRGGRGRLHPRFRSLLSSSHMPPPPPPPPRIPPPPPHYPSYPNEWPMGPPPSKFDDYRYEYEYRARGDMYAGGRGYEGEYYDERYPPPPPPPTYY
ncbi:regulation of nuclear pre-mRNA domain-containing protein 2-like [Oscarella lobularis]|uniref:regulation of nuclear pre-mRNA domain-containing protein 2-like n=1 Tax=Oscarella lobularis TaxID=121494 RepID=UPI00331368AF